MATNPFGINRYFNQFCHQSASIFNKTLHQWQVEVGDGILCSHAKNIQHNQLLIRKTGEGKSLVFLVTGACVGGVILCISPLLSLVMDQSRKVLLHAPNTCTVASFNLDEMSPSLINRLQIALRRVPPSVAIFLFTSPQCIQNRHRLHNYLLENNLITFLVIDEIHLFTQFGNTFRSEFIHLKSALFDKLRQSERTIPSLFMTATCTCCMISDLESMTGYDIDRRHWPSPSSMSHRAVGIDVKYTHHHFSLVKKTIEKALAPLPSCPTIPQKVVIYTPARNRAKSTSERLGKDLDTTANLHHIDIITLVGTMTKEEKAFYTKTFLSDEDNGRYNPHIMCATSGVGNAGIDSSKIGIVYQLGMPETISDLFQEKGRAGRYDGAISSKNRYILCFSIKDLLYFFKRIMDPDEEIINENYRVRQVEDLLQVAKVLATDQCINLQVETILGNPELNEHLPDRCGQCSSCNNQNPFFKINKEGTKSVLLDLFVFGDPGIEGKANLKALVTAIKAYPRVRKKIVSGSRSTLNMDTGEVKKVLFLLVAHGILKLHYETSSKLVIFRLAKSVHDNSVLALQHDQYWIAMESHVDLNK